MISAEAEEALATKVDFNISNLKKVGDGEPPPQDASGKFLQFKEVMLILVKGM